MRFSQEISEDHQLVLLERGAHSYVSTFDGHPYVAPFSGNIVELCPVGALTSRPYRFRARPWDVEDAGSVCTLCPSQCNVTLTVRDERVLRVQARENPEVDDGWLCDRGRFAYPEPAAARITEPLLRDGGELRPVSWERALEEAATRLSRAGARVGALAGGGASNEEGLLLGRLMRETLGSPHLDSRPAGRLELESHRALAAPALQAKVPDLEFAHAVLVLDCDPIADAPILDLRLRKGARRHGVKLVRASREQLLDEAQRGELLEELLDDRRSFDLRSVGHRARMAWSGRRSSCSGTNAWPPGPMASGPCTPCSTWPRRWVSPRSTAPGCSKSPLTPTAAACVRRGCSPTPARGSARPTRTGSTRTESPRRSREAS